MNVPRVPYGAQLAERAAELLPDADHDARLELLGVMDEADLRSSLAWLLSYAPHVFDYSLVRDRAMTRRLLERVEQAHQDEDRLEAYCSACGATIGIFPAHGQGWRHFSGNGTLASPNRLYDAGHEPVAAWRERDTAQDAQ